MTTTFLELADPLVQGSQGAFDLDSFLGVVFGAPFALLQSVHPRQHLPLQVIDLALQQILNYMLFSLMTAWREVNSTKAAGLGQ